MAKFLRRCAAPHQSAPSKLVFKLLSFCWFGPRFANFDPSLCTYPCLTATTTVQKLALAANRQPVGQLSTTYVETLCGKDRKPKIASTQSQAHHPQTFLVPRHPVDDRPQVVVKQQRFLSTTYFKPYVCVPKPNTKPIPTPFPNSMTKTRRHPMSHLSILSIICSFLPHVFPFLLAAGSPLASWLTCPCLAHSAASHCAVFRRSAFSLTSPQHRLCQPMRETCSNSNTTNQHVHPLTLYDPKLIHSSCSSKDSKATSSSFYQPR